MDEHLEKSEFEFSSFYCSCTRTKLDTMHIEKIKHDRSATLGQKSATVMGQMGSIYYTDKIFNLTFVVFLAKSIKCLALKEVFSLTGGRIKPN